MQLLSLDAALGDLTGEKHAKVLGRAFSMTTVGDLLAHYPRRYAHRGELTPISSLPVGESVTIVAEVRRSVSRPMHNRRGTLLEVTIGDGNGEMSLTFFNQAWRANELTVGRRGIFAGKVGSYRQGLQFSHPDYELFDEDEQLDASSWARTPIPIYPATGAMPSWQLRKLVASALERIGEVEEPLPREIRERDGLLGAKEALVKVHQPESDREATLARRTLRMHEALVLQTALLHQREQLRAQRATPRPAGALLERFDAAFPFDLTPDQQQVGAQISENLVGPWPMNRLVQGEVGSGKTLVALRAMLQVAESGGQAAMIAPTEVLAGQHLRSLARMLGPELATELMPTLLTGQMTAPDRRRAALRVASGQARIVVGTHALLSEKTTFADLGLVVVDEQHRFGVEQREALRAKGTHPHVLVLTATPIPRTVAMTVFGDLDVSTIRTMPKGRAPVQTFVAPLAEHPGWFGRVWERVAEEVEKGYQAFAVCSAIDSENLDAKEDIVPETDQEDATRWGVVQLAEVLSRHPRFASVRTAVLHGKLAGEEKDAIMRAFAAHEIDLLVATTVVEVGVDVPNASAMVILDADRFGVSQLHQLRGRIGRGSVPGVCLLVTEAEQGSKARERVDAVAATQDGFELAEVDLTLRGEGDVLGDAQSGARSSLKLLRVVKDADLIAQARSDAESILREDRELTQHPGLAAAIERRVDAASRAAMSKN